MISFRYFAARHGLGPLRWSLFAAALCLVSLGHAADEPDAGGTFDTPGYPARTAPAANAQNTAPNGAGNAAQPAGTTGRNGAANALTNARGNGNNGRSANNADVPLQPRAPLPPPKPTEFQRFVEGATGRLLPIFGARFFADAADSYQSLDNVPVSADYTVGPGDEIITPRLGLDRRRLPQHGRSQRHAQPAEGRQLQRGRREGVGPRAQPARADRPALHELRPERVAPASCVACASSSSARRSGPGS